MGFRGTFPGIEAKVALALFLVEAMAEKAVVREDGADVPVVADLSGTHRGEKEKGGQNEKSHGVGIGKGRDTLQVCLG